MTFRLKANILRLLSNYIKKAGEHMQYPKHAARYVSKLSNKLRRRIDAFSSREQFSGAEGKAIHFILAQPGDVFQKDIEEEYSIRPSTATELLKKMEKNGLIIRQPLPDDARMKRIIATDKALQYKDIAMHDILSLEDELTKDISKDELEIFFKVIDKMMDNIS